MSVEPPMIRPPEIDMDRVSPRIRELAESRGVPMDDPGAVLAGRKAARDLVAAHPEVSPTGAVYLDCRKVEIVTPSYVDELLKLWPHVQIVGANPDVAASWELVSTQEPTR